MDIDESLLSGQYITKDLPADELAIRLKNLSKALAEANHNTDQALKFKQIAFKLVDLAIIDDKELQLIIACCIIDILRIVAPSQIFKEKQIKKVFELFERVTKFLRNPNEATFQQIMHVIVVIADISATAIAIRFKSVDIVIKIIQSLLENMPNEIGHTGEQAVGVIILTTLEEIHDLKENQIYPIVSSLSSSFSKRPRLNAAKAALSQTSSDIKQCINDYIYKLFVSPKDLKTSTNIGNEKFLIVYRLYKINPDYVMTLLSCLPEHMNESKTGLKIIDLVGKMATSKKSVLPNLHLHLYNEFLKKFEDPSEIIREIVLNSVVKFVKNHRNKSEIIDVVLKQAGDRLRDKADKIRKQAVMKVCECSKFITLDKRILDRVCERVKDKKLNIRSPAIKNLAIIYHNECVFQYSING